MCFTCIKDEQNIYIDQQSAYEVIPATYMKPNGWDAYGTRIDGTEAEENPLDDLFPEDKEARENTVDKMTTSSLLQKLSTVDDDEEEAILEKDVATSVKAPLIQELASTVTQSVASAAEPDDEFIYTRISAEEKPVVDEESTPLLREFVDEQKEDELVEQMPEAEYVDEQMEEEYLEEQGMHFDYLSI
jgi:hypothetical protein